MGLLVRPLPNLSSISQAGSWGGRHEAFDAFTFATVFRCHVTPPNLCHYPAARRFLRMYSSGALGVTNEMGWHELNGVGGPSSQGPAYVRDEDRIGNKPWIGNQDHHWSYLGMVQNQYPKFGKTTHRNTDDSVHFWDG